MTSFETGFVPDDSETDVVPDDSETDVVPDNSNIALNLSNTIEKQISEILGFEIDEETLSAAKNILPLDNAYKELNIKDKSALKDFCFKILRHILKYPKTKKVIYKRYKQKISNLPSLINALTFDLSLN